jgi:hypothetical protein
LKNKVPDEDDLSDDEKGMIDSKAEERINLQIGVYTYKELKNKKVLINLKFTEKEIPKMLVII